MGGRRGFGNLGPKTSVSGLQARGFAMPERKGMSCMCFLGGGGILFWEDVEGLCLRWNGWGWGRQMGRGLKSPNLEKDHSHSNA